MDSEKTQHLDLITKFSSRVTELCNIRSWKGVINTTEFKSLLLRELPKIKLYHKKHWSDSPWTLTSLVPWPIYWGACSSDQPPSQWRNLPPDFPLMPLHSNSMCHCRKTNTLSSLPPLRKFMTVRSFLSNPHCNSLKEKFSHLPCFIFCGFNTALLQLLWNESTQIILLMDSFQSDICDQK